MRRTLSIASLIVLIATASRSLAAGSVVHDATAHLVTMADGKGALSIRLNYDDACYLDRVSVNGRETVNATTGVCSALKVAGVWATTRHGIATPEVTIDGANVTVDRIRLGGGVGGVNVHERWHFTVGEDRIDWQISREYDADATIEDTYFPGWDFAAMDTWTGALLDTGGVAWCRYLPEGSSYGAHSASATFFSPRREGCLRVTSRASEGAEIAARFSHQPSGVFSYVQSAAKTPLTTAHDLHRFNRSLDVWSPFVAKPETVDVRMTLQVIDEDVARGRGTFVGVDGNTIGDLLDTIGRYGVIDRGIMGGNGWLTGFVCLHEPFFAAMGAAIADPAYIANFAATLDAWRDQGQKPDGRVLSRWHHDLTDNMVPGTYDTKTGLYECGWGYTLDSQPDYVINTSELFDLTGDLVWLRAHKASCEKALDWLLARDSDGNGLVEMLTDTHTNNKSSDWIDIVWASHENALVNAAMYEAMTQWAGREELLGDEERAKRYRDAAGKLRDAFRKPTTQGGFWNEKDGWFAYWRERDGSIHGDNFVTPVNFCAIAYGIADETQRKRILDGMERRMREEKLFHWPLCFLPYAPGEGANATFPDYENGDIFLSWGEVAVRSYANYDPAIAMAYVHRVLERYKEDGLSFQRYLRRDQKGAGDDVLAGNCMTIVGLYRDIYGVRPLWNRLRLDPHLTPDLEGTTLAYPLRGQRYELALGMQRNAIAVDGFTLRAGGSFAAASHEESLFCFNGDAASPTITVSRAPRQPTTVEVEIWPTFRGGRWKIDHPTGARITIAQLQPDTAYRLSEGAQRSEVHSDATGNLTLTAAASDGPVLFDLAVK